MPPDASFPVPTRLASGKCGSICEGRGRPRMISTAFDPTFLSSRKGVAIRPDLKKTGMAGCPRIKNAVLLKRTSNARPHPFVRVSARSDKRMQKRRRGSPGPQMVSRFSFRKTGVAFFSRTDVHTTREPEASGDRLGAGLKKCGNPSPGPQPFLYGRELGPASESIFIERKSTKPPGAPRGGPPWHVFAFFLRVKKEGGPQARLEKTAFRYVRAKRTRCYKKDIKCAATSFCPRRQKDAKTPLGVLPPNPQKMAGFLFRKTGIHAFSRTKVHTTRGPGAPGVRLDAGMKNCSNPNPGAAAPFLYMGGFGYPPSRRLS